MLIALRRAQPTAAQNSSGSSDAFWPESLWRYLYQVGSFGCWLVKLDALRLVELRTKLRARARAGSSIIWRRDGPVRRLYERQVRQEFLQSSFALPNEALHFRSAELSEASCRVLLRKLERLTHEFRDLAELDRTLPVRERRSVAVLLAVRPWVFCMFEGLLMSAGSAK